MSRRALITGITGQDGSYLAELLLDHGYEVHGMVRRASTEKFDRIEHLKDRITLHQGDLLDHRSLTDALKASRPDEIYNLAAMSFVAVSWIQPTLTAEFTGVGVTRVLEAMREVCPEARFYQASSSEMFGKVRQVPQTEETPFYPRSPYGVAKAYGHFITVNYRESYDLHATSGILFNHECVVSDTPLLVREDGVVAVRTPPDLAPLRRHGPSTQPFEPRGFTEVWDGESWTPITAITATRRRPADPDHELVCVEAGAGAVQVTSHHHMLDADRETLRARDVEAGDRLAVAEEAPPTPAWAAITPELAELLGLLVADGSIDDFALHARVGQLWSRTFLGTQSATPWLREQLYSPTGLRQVPPVVLNGDAEAHQAFLRGLRGGDGDSITTGSPVLALGLYWLYALNDQVASVSTEQVAGMTSYRLELPTAVRVGATGGPLRRDPAEVRHVRPAVVPDDEWVFDIETESGVFCAGVGRLVVHNSPRRGLEFVTRKITWHAAAIKLGLADELRLGNLDAERDWGYAKDYVDAMWRMLQEDTPEDFVIATGETHTVRDCVQVAFDQAGVGDWERYVTLDPAFVRPAEVDQLIGDYSKAERILGWKPETTFEQLIRLMVDADLRLLGDRRLTVGKAG